MTQGAVANAGESVWKAGTLSADELERLAGEIRPSWEIGLEAANEVAVVNVAAIVPTANGFSAPSGALAADLGSMAGSGASSPVVPSFLSSAAVSPATAKPVTKTLAPPATATLRPAMAYDDARTIESDSRPWEEARPAGTRSKGLLFGGIGVVVVLIGAISVFSMRGSDAPSASANATTAMAPSAPSSAAVAPTVEAPVPTQAPAEVSPAPAAAAPIAPRPGAHASVVHAPVAHAPVAPVVAAAPARSTHVERPAAPAVAPRTATHAGTPRPSHRARGTGFVTDSPY